MINLTRRVGETVEIFEKIYCTVLAIDQNEVRLGFTPVNKSACLQGKLQLKVVIDGDQKAETLFTAVLADKIP